MNGFFKETSKTNLLERYEPEPEKLETKTSFSYNTVLKDFKKEKPEGIAELGKIPDIHEEKKQKEKKLKQNLTYDYVYENYGDL